MYLYRVWGQTLWHVFYIRYGVYYMNLYLYRVCSLARMFVISIRVCSLARMFVISIEHVVISI